MNEVELHLLKSHRLNPNRLTEEGFDKLVSSMRHFGICAPIIIRPHPKKTGQYITIDGHHRIQAAKILGWKTIPCQIWNISAKDARLALATLNRLRGTDIPQKRTELLSSLTQAFSIQDLAQLIPESDRPQFLVPLGNRGSGSYHSPEGVAGIRRIPASGEFSRGWVALF